MSRSLTICDRQQAASLRRQTLRKGILLLLSDLFRLTDWELVIHLVDDREMTPLNERFLSHQGSTDVITFNLDDLDPATKTGMMRGEIFVCVEEARRQARRYHTSWAMEVMRYIVHALLHLQGYDDHDPADRRRMKRRENRLTAQWSRLIAPESIGSVRKAKA